MIAWTLFACFDPHPPQVPAAIAFTDTKADAVLLHIQGRPPLDDALPAPPMGGTLDDLKVTTTTGQVLEVREITDAAEGVMVLLPLTAPGELLLSGTYVFPDGTAVALPRSVGVGRPPRR